MREQAMKEVLRIISIYQRGCSNTQRMQGDDFVPGDPTTCDECNELVIGLLSAALLEAPAAGFAEGVEASACVSDACASFAEHRRITKPDDDHQWYYAGQAEASRRIAKAIRALKAPGQEGEEPAHD